MFVSLFFMQSKYIKIHQQEIPPIRRNVLEFFCATLYTGCLSGLPKKFQLLSTHDADVEYQT